MSVWRRRLVRFVGWWIAAFASFVAIGLIVLAGYLLLFDYPETIRHRLEQQLTRLTGAPASIGSINLNIAEYAIELRGIRIEGPAGEEGAESQALLSVESIIGRLQITEILRWRLHWNELSIRGLRARLVQDTDSAMRLPPEVSEAPDLAATGLRIAADRVLLEDAAVVLMDETIPLRLEASGLRFSLARDGASHKGTIAYEDGSVTIKDHPEVRGSASAAIELSAGELFIHEAEAGSELGTLNVKGKASLAGGLNGRFELEAEGELDRVASSLLGARARPSVSGLAAFRGSLDVSPIHAQLEGSILLERGRLLGAPLEDWRADVFWDRQLFQISLAEGRLASGQARLQLHQPFPVADHPAAFDLDVANARLSALVESVRSQPSPVESRLSGRVSLAIPSATPGLASGSFHLRGAFPDDVATLRPIELDATGTISDGNATITAGALRTRTLRASLAGIYPRTGDVSLDVDVSSDDLSELDSLGVEIRRLLRSEDEDDPAPWGISGRGRAVGRLEGRLPHPTFVGDVFANGLSFDRLYLDDVRGSGVMSRQELRLDTLVGRKGEGRAEGTGSVALTGELGSRDFEVRLDVESWPGSDLTTLLDWGISVEGAMGGTIDLRREQRRVAGTTRVAFSDPILLGERFDRAELRARFDGSSVTLRDAVLVRNGVPLEGELDIDTVSGVIRGKLIGNDFPLSGTKLMGLPLEGVLGLEATVSGTTAQPIVDLTGETPMLSVQGLSFPGASIGGRLEEGRFDVSIQLAEDFTVTAAGELEGDVPVSGVIRFDALDTGPWLSRVSETLVASTAVLATGEARFQSTLRGSGGLEAEATLSEIVIENESLRLASLAPVQARLSDGVLRVPSLSLAREDSRVELGVSVDFPASTIDLRAEGSTDLQLLTSLYDNVAASGAVDLSARVVGSWDQPSLSGHADLTGATLRLEGFPQALGDLRGRLVFDNRTIRVEELQGVFGTGPISLSGALSLDGWQMSSIDMRLSGTDMRLRYPEGLVATIDAELGLLGTRDEKVLSGDVVLTDAVWSREYELVAGVLSDRETNKFFDTFEGDGFFDNVRFDVQIHAPGSLRLRNAVAEIDGSAELELRGSLSEPVLLGTTEAERGELFLLGQRYDITSGKVDFVDPTRIEPFVELIAETRVRSYRVELRLTGTTQRFSPELSSDPPLRTVDILRLLSGASERDIGNTLVGNEEEELAGLGVASLLTERLSQEVGRRAERLFGLDRFSIDPFLVGRIANPTARVSLGKQITRDLSINYSTNLNATTEAIILIEYTPEGNMSWILSRDEEGDVAVDVKFRKSF